MKFLVDEGCDFSVVLALRASGYDVLAVCELSPAMTDQNVILLARSQKRILITEDKDFGQIFHAFWNKKVTVVFIRYPTQARSSLPSDIVKLISAHGNRIRGAFVVMEPGRVRFSK